MSNYSLIYFLAALEKRDRKDTERGNIRKRPEDWWGIETCSVSPWNKFLYLKMGLKHVFKQGVKRGLKLREEQQMSITNFWTSARSKKHPFKTASSQPCKKGHPKQTLGPPAAHIWIQTSLVSGSAPVPHPTPQSTASSESPTEERRDLPLPDLTPALQAASLCAGSIQALIGARSRG